MIHKFDEFINESNTQKFEEFKKLLANKDLTKAKDFFLHNTSALKEFTKELMTDPALSKAWSEVYFEVTNKAMSSMFGDLWNPVKFM